MGHRAHVEKARGTDEENLTYCTESDQQVFIYGTPSIGTTEHGGGSNHLRAAVGWAHYLANKAGTSNMVESDATVQPGTEEAFILYHKSIKVLLDIIVENANRGEHLTQYTNVNWSVFQKEIIDLCGQKPDDRKVHWIVDTEGNRGKISV